MPEGPVSLRIPPETRGAIDEVVRRTGRDFSSVANELLAEGVKMRRIPGIVFADSPSGRVARISGTGLAVWELVAEFQALGQEWGRLRQAFHWLSEAQLRAALAYAAAYPEEIAAAVDDEASWTQERVWSTFPFTRPPAP
jgi:uncharacterized protein (DUF433 family)